jgi:hypothetical protein
MLKAVAAGLTTAASSRTHATLSGIDHAKLALAKALLAETALRAAKELPEEWPPACTCGCEPRANLLMTARMAGR